MPTLEFFYDIASPYSYLASTRVEAIVADTGATLRWRPFLLGGVFKATGNTMPAAVPARGRYLHDDLHRWASYYRVPLQWNPRFPPNTLMVMRLLSGLSPDEVPDASHWLFQTFWVEGRDVTEPTVLAERFGPTQLARAQDPEVKAALRATTDEAVSRGAFGAPSFFVDNELFFGNDRLPFFEQRLRE